MHKNKWPTNTNLRIYLFFAFMRYLIKCITANFNLRKVRKPTLGRLRGIVSTVKGHLINLPAASTGENKFQQCLLPALWKDLSITLCNKTYTRLQDLTELPRQWLCGLYCPKKLTCARLINMWCSNAYDGTYRRCENTIERFPMR